MPVFLDAVNFVAGNPEADPEQELSDRWVVEQMSAADSHDGLVCAGYTDRDGWGAVSRSHHAGEHLYVGLPGDECGYNGPAVADEFDNPTTDIRKDRCSKCMRGCELRRNVGNFWRFPFH
ncbi:phage minor tail protein L [Escherichia coli]|uniref:phage minor tail protein L n=1 Tax=Escherichia coli TaxID=562 RepID=UPI003D9CAC48